MARKNKVRKATQAMTTEILKGGKNKLEPVRAKKQKTSTPKQKASTPKQKERANTKKKGTDKTPARAKRRKVKSNKRFTQFLKNYEAAISEGRLRPIKEIERLKAKYKWNKDGTPNLNYLRSDKARKEFNEDITNFNKTYKRWGKKAVAEMGEEQHRKTQERLAKGARTFAEKGYKEAKDEAQKRGYDFRENANTVLQEYYTAAEIFGMDSYTKLAEQFNLGSKTPALLAQTGLSKEDLNTYLDDFMHSYENVPKEARKYVSQDDIVRALQHSVDLVGKENFQDTLMLFLENSGDRETQERILKMSLFYSEHAEETNKSFYGFYKEFERANYKDQDNEKNWGEIL